jgi:hypothetical protein
MENLYWLIVVVPICIVAWFEVKGIRAYKNSTQYYNNDPCEECEDELDDDEIAYWVSRGWSAGDGPPPR